MSAPRTGAHVTLENRVNHLVLVRTDLQGARTEIPISEPGARRLSQLLPQLVHRMASRHSLQSAGLTAVASIPAKVMEVRTDVHNSKLMLSIRDATSEQFNFTLSLPVAKQLGERLIARAAAAEEAARKTTKQ